MYRWSCVLLLGAVIAGGCSEGRSQISENEAAGSGAETKSTQSPDSPAANPQQRQADSMTGSWYLVISQATRPFEPRQDLYLAMLKITGSGDTLRGELLAKRDEDDSAELIKPNLTAKTADFQMTLLGRPVRFSGTFRDGVVWGNLLNEARGTVEPARLVPAAADASEIPREPQPPEGYKALESLVKAEDRYAAFAAFVEEHPQSPLAVDAAMQMLVMTKQKDFDAAQVDATADKYFETAKRWGPRMLQFARLNSAFVLAGMRHQPQLSDKYLDAVEKNLTDDSPDGWPRLIEIGRQLADVAIALVQLESEDADEQQQARADLNRLLKKDVFNHLILFHLAEDAARRDDLEEALLRYAQLSVLPRLAEIVKYEFETDEKAGPDVRARLEELWQEKHGNVEDLQAFLNDVYRKSIYSFTGSNPLPAPPDAGNQVALVELFTGSRCPPCLAADVAVGGLEAMLSKNDLIVLRYHQHIPGPDPLANPQTEQRFDYYADPADPYSKGTPSTFVNGNKVEGVVGDQLDRYVDQSFELLREAVEPVLAQNTDVKIELSAEAKDGQLEISARVDGLKEPGGQLRLRLALAEDEVEFLAPNEIRLHEMVVRTMPGGPEGIAPKDGKLEFTETIPLSEFRQRLVDELTTLEEGVGEKFSVEIEPKELHLVGFVQNDSTHKVLQAAATPVKGKLEYPAATAAASSKKPDAKPAPKSAGPELQPPQTNGNDE